MKRLKRILKFLLISSILYTVPIDYVQSGLKPYVVRYETRYLAKCNLKRLESIRKKIIVFLPLPSSRIVGLCFNLGSNKIILVDTDYFKDLDEESRTELVWHELSHCLLNKGHTSEWRNYMYPNLQDLTMSELKAQVDEDLDFFCKGDK